SEGITPPSSLLRAHAPDLLPSPTSGLGLMLVIFAGCYRPLLVNRSFPTLSLRIFPRMPGPLPRRHTECIYLFLPPCHRPSPTEDGSAYRFSPRTRFCAEAFSRLQTFLNVQASKFACLPDRSYRCATLPQGS